MYKSFELNTEKAIFEWDDEKDQINFRKHGLHFKTAAKVFLDPNKLIRVDEEHFSENRYNVLGRVGRVLFVVCVFRGEHVIRLISARFATQLEKERYQNDSYEF